MVSRATTTALILLTLVLMAAPALAEEIPNSSEAEETNAEAPPCPIWSLGLSPPTFELHPQCIS
jgi:hypothetical protein